MVELREKQYKTLSLIREKSVIVEQGSQNQGGSVSETIRSNRCDFILGDDLVVVRGQYIHLTLRISAHIIKEFEKEGAFGGRAKPVDWRKLWLDAQSIFDREHDQIGWVQIYINGETVYSTYKSDYMDIIEKCAVSGEVKSYDETLGVTERLLAESGHHVEINHSAILSVSMNEREDSIRCGLTHRSDKRDMIFSFTVMNEPNPATFWQCTELAAEFLEIINLTYGIERLKRKLSISKSSVESGQLAFGRDCRDRRSKLEKSLNDFEGIHKVRYRPERPHFGSEDDYNF